MLNRPAFGHIFLIYLFFCIPGWMANPSPAQAGARDAAHKTQATTLVSGNAFNFSASGGMLEGAQVSVLEYPGLLAVTDEDGYFQFEGLEPGSTATFLLMRPDYHATQTGTLTVGAEGLEQVSFQVPSTKMFRAMAAMVPIVPDPRRCQIASTVTRRGASLYTSDPTHGEAGARVTIDPPVPAEQGPIYFNLVTSNVIYPDRSLTETTEDGGVLFVNVPPGEYTLTAHKDGVEISPVRVLCRPGMLVNASPPHGLQVQ